MVLLIIVGLYALFFMNVDVVHFVNSPMMDFFSVITVIGNIITPEVKSWIVKKQKRGKE